MDPKALLRYQNLSVQTASQEKLLLDLWRGAVRMAKLAKTAGEKKDIQLMHTECMKLQEIFIYLARTIHPDYPEPDQLEGLYLFYYQQTVNANVAKDPALLVPVIEFLESWQTVWDQATQAVRKAVVH